MPYRFAFPPGIAQLVRTGRGPVPRRVEGTFYLHIKQFYYAVQGRLGRSVGRGPIKVNDPLGFGKREKVLDPAFLRLDPLPETEQGGRPKGGLRDSKFGRCPLGQRAVFIFLIHG